jgi:hypothetical protein
MFLNTEFDFVYNIYIIVIEKCTTQMGREYLRLVFTAAVKPF